MLSTTSLERASPADRHVTARRSPTIEHGFTLLEVLVAATVVALAVIGAVALQVAALRSLRSALEHAAAAHLAADLVERLTAMPSQAAAYSCAPCNAAQAALAPSAQLADWLAQVQSSLPSSRVSVAVDASGTARPQRVRVALEWGDRVSSHVIVAPLPAPAP